MTKMVCEDVKVEPDVSTRSMADLIGGIAAKGWKCHEMLIFAIKFWREGLPVTLAALSSP